MDTKKESAAAEVPTFKVARVGKDRKKKGGGLSWFRSARGSGSFSGATGGMGAGAGGVYGAAAAATGLTASQIAILSIVAAAFIGAMTLGALAGQSTKGKVAEKKTFNSHDGKIEGDTSNLPTNANSIPNSLGYISGSVDGLTPEERARLAAEAAAKKAADEEAARKAEEEAAKKDQVAGNPAVDPNALLASAKGDGKPANGSGSPFGKKFGSLSSGTGSSSLNGGAGLSGGVGRGFAGASGGIPKGNGGQLSGNRAAAKPTTTHAARAAMGKSNMKGFARSQLLNANKYSRRASAAGVAENGSSDAGTAFDNNPGQGNVITGAGLGGGGHGQGTPDGGGGINTNGSPTGGDTGPKGCQFGIDEATQTCKEKDTGSGTNVTPYQWMYDLAIGLMMLTSILGVMAMVFDKIPWLTGVAQALKVAIMAIGGVIAALGVAIIAMCGDIIAGGILTIVGGFIAVSAYQLEKTGGTFTQEAVKQLVLKTVIATALGGFAVSMAHKPAAASQ